MWTSGLARVVDTSLRYTVDKTTREILFLPLPADVKYRAKPFIDVTVDRLSKGAGALPDPGAHQGLGIGADLAAAELRQPDHHGLVGVLRPAGPRRVHGGLPPQHRAAGHEGRRDPPRDGRPLDHRGPGRRAGPSGRQARGLRPRPARVARQAPPGQSADALPRASRRPGAGVAPGRGHRTRRRRAVAARHRARTDRSRRRRAQRGGPRPGQRQGPGGRGADAPLPRRRRPGAGGDGGVGAVEQHRRGRPRPRDGGLPQAHRRLARAAGPHPRRGGARARPGHQPGVPDAARAADVRRRCRRRPRRHPQRGAARGRRLPVRAAAGVAAAQPPAEGRRARSARRLRRGGGPDARLLHEGSRRGSVGAPAHPGDAGPHSLPGVAAGAARGARGSRRLPALQGAVGRRAAAAEPARSRRAPGHRREARRRRDRPRVRPAHVALQPVPRRRARPGLPAGARPHREVRARPQPRVHAA